MPRSVAVRIHCVHHCLLSLFLLLGRKVGSGHSGEGVPRGREVRKVEAEHFGFNMCFDTRLSQLLEKERWIGQRARPYARNRWSAGKLARSLLKEDDVALVSPRPNRRY